MELPLTTRPVDRRVRINLLNLDCWEPVRNCLIKRLQEPKIMNGNRRGHWDSGYNPPLVQIWDLQAWGWLWFGQNIAMNVIFGATYVNKCTRGMFPVERKIVLEHSVPVVILGWETETGMTVIVLWSAYGWANETSNNRVAKLITILCETRPPVFVLTSKCGLLTIERTQTAKPTQGIVPAGGLREVWIDVSLIILGTTISEDTRCTP